MLTGTIKNLAYNTKININLPEGEFNDDVNNWPVSCIVKTKNYSYAVSKWVSPKRTRSYPFERVYNTFHFTGKRVTIIPIIKDEGIDGDKDSLQWSTIALMSLLNVYVILAYYIDGTKRRSKITKQKFDSAFVKKQFGQLNSYHQSALHWNLNQMTQENLSKLLGHVIKSYAVLGKKTGIKFHSSSLIEYFQKRISEEAD